MTLSEQMGMVHSEGAGALAEPAHPAVAPAWEETISVCGTPQNALESQLLEVWEELLGRSGISTRARFSDIGGNPALAERMVTLIDERLGRKLEPQALAEHPTIEQLSLRLLRDQQRGSAHRPFVTIHPQGSKRPFFFLHGDYVGGGFFCKTLAQQIGAERPFYAVHPHGLHGDPPPPSFTIMAADRLSAIRAVQPQGPYLLGGYCNGALVAFEMARLLEAEGEEVSALIMLMADGENYRTRYLHRLARLVGGLRRDDLETQQRRLLGWVHGLNFLRGSWSYHLGAARELLRRPPPEMARRLWRKGGRILARLCGHGAAGSVLPPGGAPGGRVADAFSFADVNFLPQKYRGQITLLWPEDEVPEEGCDETYGWRSVSPSVRLLSVPGEHHTCVSQVRHVRSIGGTMRGVLDAVSPAPGTEVLAP